MVGRPAADGLQARRLRGPSHGQEHQGDHEHHPDRGEDRVRPISACRPAGPPTVVDSAAPNSSVRLGRSRSSALRRSSARVAATPCRAPLLRLPTTRPRVTEAVALRHRARRGRRDGFSRRGRRVREPAAGTGQARAPAAAAGRAPAAVRAGPAPGQDGHAGQHLDAGLRRGRLRRRLIGRRGVYRRRRRGTTRVAADLAGVGKDSKSVPAGRRPWWPSRCRPAGPHP